MQDFCPLCMKNGVKKKVKLLQINLQEAVWMCEGEKCAWPFGYEDFIYFPRTVGKVWSCYWDNHKPTASGIRDTVVTPTGATLCNTTMYEDKSKGTINIPLPKTNSRNTHLLTTSSIAAETKNTSTDINIDTFAHKKQNGLLPNNNQNQNDIANNVMNIQFDNSSELNFSNFDIPNDCTKSKDVKSVVTMLEKETDLNLQNGPTTNSTRGLPKITSIQKTNIDISNVIVGSSIPAYLDQNKNGLNINKVNNIKKKLVPSQVTKSISSKVQHSKNITDLKSVSDNHNNNETTKATSNVNVTRMELDGLPPITLSYEIPSCATISEMPTTHGQSNNLQNSDGKDLSNKTLIVTSPRTKSTVSMKHNLTRGKQYQKFSFSAIKKKLQMNSNSTNNSTTTPTNKANVKTQDERNDAVTVMENQQCNLQKTIESTASYNNCNNVTMNSSTDCNQINVKCSNNSDQTISSTNAATSVAKSTTPEKHSLQNQLNILSLDTSIVNTSENIDTVLEDFLTNDYSVSEDINDEWINSLLS